MPGFTLPYWLWPGDDRPPEEIEDEVREELALHLELLTERLRREGLDPATAERVAAERFGDVESIARDCRKIQQGDLLMLKRVQAVLTGLLLVAVVAVGWQQWRIGMQLDGTATVMGEFSSQLREISGRLAIMQPPLGQAADASAGAGEMMGGEGERGMGGMETGASLGGGERAILAPTPVVIRVIDEDGKPIPKASMTISHRNDEGEEYGDFDVSTDDDGVYVLKPKRNWEHVGASVSARGRVFTYTEIALGELAAVIRLPKAQQQTLILLNSEGKPIPRVRVTAHRRVDSDGKEYGFGHPTPHMARADDQGKVAIDWFAPGDEAYLYCNVPLQPQIMVAAFEVLGDPDKPIEVEVKPQSGLGGGGGQF
ncbi:MAG: permease prefix domain 1-containing protein [Lacipirellulaceae bacterium]